MYTINTNEEDMTPFLASTITKEVGEWAWIEEFDNYTDEQLDRLIIILNEDQ